MPLRTLGGWRYRGGGPPWIAINHTTIRYQLEDIERWLAEQTRQSPSKARH